jgi:hypothetical protein
VAVGGILGLIDDDGTPPAAESGRSGGRNGLALGVLAAGTFLALAAASVTRKRLLG